MISLDMASLTGTHADNDFAINVIQFGESCGKKGLWEENVIQASNGLLEVNYPNPFSDFTAVLCNLPESGQVNLFVTDLFGRQMAGLVNGWKAEGPHQVHFESGELEPGVYL